MLHGYSNKWWVYQKFKFYTRFEFSGYANKITYAVSKSELSKLSIKMGDSNIKIFCEHKWEGEREHLFK